MQELRDLPAQGRRIVRRQAEPSRADFDVDEIDQLAPQLLGLRARCEQRARHFRGERPAQRAFLLDLPHRASDPVDVVGSDRTLMRAHPRRQITVRVEAFAVHEYPAQAAVGTPRQVDNALVRGPVTASDEREIDGQIRALHTVCLDVAERRIVQTASRAKCRRSNCPNGRIGFAGSAIPGAAFIVSSKSRRLRSRSGAISANTMNWDCGVTAPLSSGSVKRRL